MLRSRCSIGSVRAFAVETTRVRTLIHLCEPARLAINLGLLPRGTTLRSEKRHISDHTHVRYTQDCFNVQHRWVIPDCFESAGMQMGYFLQSAGRDYVVLERNATAGKRLKKKCIGEGCGCRVRSGVVEGVSGASHRALLCLLV